MIRLEKTTGPAECPKCGYEGSDVLGEYQWTPGGAATVRLRCKHCGARYTAPSRGDDDAPVAAAGVEARAERPVAQRCTELKNDGQACGGAMWAYRTRGSVRYLKCRACGATGKRAG